MIKGAGAIELWFGLNARATRDIDLELPLSLDRLASAFSTALARGFGEFAFAVEDSAQPIRDQAVRVQVTMTYFGRGWATLDIDLAPLTERNQSTTLAIGSPEAGITSVTRALKLEYIIAQNIHAATTADRPDYQYDYARHVVDVLFLIRGVDLTNVRAACVAVFERRSSRDGRTWPPVFSLPDRWLGDYGEVLAEYRMTLSEQDVPIAFSQLLCSLVEVTLCPVLSTALSSSTTSHPATPQARLVRQLKREPFSSTVYDSGSRWVASCK